MPPNSLRVTLIAPGCFAAVAQMEDDVPVPAENSKMPEANDSQAILTKTQAYEQALAQALQQPIPAMGALPAAVYQYEADSGEAVPEHCVCVELIHLQADKDNARLLPELALNISNDESNDLLESLNQLINPDGLDIHRSKNGRCYLTGMPAAALDTWPAHAVANGKIANFLPRQSAAGDWRRLLTEVQMLFHAHPVNLARASLQQLPINGMWFWGGTKAPPLSPVKNVLLVADDAYACGLGAALNLSSLPLASCAWSDILQRLAPDQEIDGASIGEISFNEVVIVDLCAYRAWLSGEQADLSDAKRRLHDLWISPAQIAVTDGLVSEFVLDGCEGQAIVERPVKGVKGGLAKLQWLVRSSLKRFVPSRFVPRGDK